MATYISVLLTHVNNSIWRAVQVGQSLAEIDNNNFYTAGVNWSFPKSPNDELRHTKRITEVATGSNATAQVVKLSAETANLLRLASGTATEAMIKKISKKLKKPSNEK